MKAGSVGERVLGRARLALAGGEEFVPRQLAVAWRPGRVRSSDHDTCSTSFGPASIASSTIASRSTSLALAVGDVGRQHEARAARPDAFAQRARTEAGEHDAVDRPDPDGREHRDDRLGRRRHVDREAVALADAEAAQAGGDPLDLGEELGVGQGAAAAPLVERDQGA